MHIKDFNACDAILPAGNTNSTTFRCKPRSERIRIATILIYTNEAPCSSHFASIRVYNILDQAF